MKGGSNSATLKAQADTMGQSLFKKWNEVRLADIEKIKDMFDENGIIKGGEHADLLHSASFFSDLYKWTMTPVIRALEKTHGNITVTFGIDLRDPKMIQMLFESLNNDKSSAKEGSLITKIDEALQTLTQRKFKQDVFKHVLSGPRDKIFDVGGMSKQQNIDEICGPSTSEKTLVDEVMPFIVKQLEPEYLTMTSDERVVIRFYFDSTKSDKYGNKGVFFIEATGPWHRVTWLETSLMQCVYETTLRHELTVSYYDWLNSALLRTAKSICFSYLVQGTKGGKPFPALFTGRRTGGRLFILLQNLMFADTFTSGPDSKPLSGSMIADFSSILPGQQKCLGTSSCDSNYILTQKLGLPCHPPIGTNAHEMRMVSSIMYAHLDQNIESLPLSQIIVDYLYYLHVWNKTGGPGPALPDTVGTPAFMKAAEFITFGPDVAKKDPAGAVINPNPTLLQLIGLPRQDSGELQQFLDTMGKFGYTGLTMASEIDTTGTLFEAAEKGYFCYGAGGFFGDSEKIWESGSRSNKLAMAVKPVRVVFTTSVPTLLKGIPYVSILTGNKVVGFPVKLGDASDPAKVSIDRNLSSDMVKNLVNFFIARKDYVEKDNMRFNKRPASITSLFNDSLLRKLKPVPQPPYVKNSKFPTGDWKMFTIQDLIESRPVESVPIKNTTNEGLNYSTFVHEKRKGGRRTHKRRRINRKKTSKRRR